MKLNPSTGPFIVWSPDGETPPKVVHDTHPAAHKAAHAMADRFPGQSFMVMSKNGKVISREPASEMEASS